MVSIMTTMVLMIVITLIVLGFAQISRRNQREALDRQLSTQAFYAAETGINDARKLIQTAVTAGTTVADKTGCTDTGTGGFYGSLNPTIDAAANVKYSCLLVDPSPKVLRYSDVGTTSVIVPMTATTGTFSTIKIDWQSKIVGGTPTSGCPTTLPAGAGNGQFSPTATWVCGYGVLRFDLVPTTGALDSESLRNATMTTFAVPFASGGTASIPYSASTANANNVRGITCTNAGCSLTVSGLTQASYYLRVSSLYRNVSMQISGANGVGSQLEIQGAQAVIDSTGRAQDVLRRIQVNVPYRSSSENQLSEYAIQSTDAICKRFSVMNGFFDTAVAGVTSAGRLCQP
ncbi:MAG: pilus assembly PilX N-terminal domain-containing protein [Candidatus Saccharimonadales bacterium]